jgi:hypothetical protein
MIDNLKQLLPLLIFESEDDFYWLQVIVRGKDSKLTSADNRYIKNYHIKSIEQLYKVYPEVQTLCDVFGARAYIHLNKRSFRKTSLKTLALIAQDIESNNFECVKRAYDSSCGRHHNARDKKWLLDIDNFDVIWLRQFMEELETLPNYKLYTAYPTQSGMHLICSPFDMRYIEEDRFLKLISLLDVHIFKDGQSLLYCNLNKKGGL